MTRGLVALALLCVALSQTFGEEEFTFDFSEVEPEAYSYGGYLEFRPTLSVLESDNVLYGLSYPGDEGPDTETRYLLRAQLEGTYDWDDVHLELRTNSDLTRSSGDWEATSSIHEAFAGWQVNPYLTVDVGKKLTKWGTGYSWNPVAFLDRPKNPDEPDLPRAGYTLASADYVKTFPGSLQNVGVTLAVIPRTSHLNSGFGSTRHTNYAGRLHLLWDDTDIDLMALSGGSQPVRYGLDFARNLKTNFEIHGEWSHTPTETRTAVAADGTLRTDETSVDRALLGLRYLTAGDVTYILEYQYNGFGFSQSEMRSFYTFANEAVDSYVATGDATQLTQARLLSRQLYSSRPLGKRYLYLRASQKEPNDILYFTPAVTLQVNLDDGSFSVTPEALYTGYENWELRARLFVLGGGGDTEFGAKPNRARFELMARRYF